MKVAPWVAVGAFALGLGSACGGDSNTSWGGSSGSGETAAGAPNGMSGKGGLGGSAGTAHSGSSSGGRATAGEGGSSHAGAIHFGGAGGDAEVGGAGGGAAAGGVGGDAEPGGAGGAPPSAGGAAGSESAAGAGGDGGIGGEAPLECEPASLVPTQLPSCQPLVAAEPCGVCLNARCCLEWQTCYGKAPKSVCGYGEGPNAPGQLDCVRECYLESHPAAADWNDAVKTCAQTCAGACVNLAPITNDVIACAMDECVDECFPVE